MTCTLQDWIISWIVTISMSLLLMKFAQISETAMTGKENIRAGILAANRRNAHMMPGCMLNGSHMNFDKR